MLSDTWYQFSPSQGRYGRKPGMQGLLIAPRFLHPCKWQHSEVGMGDISFLKSIRYQQFLVVSIPNFDTDTSKFKPSSTVLLWHNIVTKMVLDNCAKFYLEHNWWFYHSQPRNAVFVILSVWHVHNYMILPSASSIKYTSRKKSHFSAFFSIWLTFSWGFHIYMLIINRAGSASKTSDTWWK